MWNRFGNERMPKMMAMRVREFIIPITMVVSVKFYRIEERIVPGLIIITLIGDRRME